MGSALVALDGGSGNATARVLYDPYGRVRYSTGAMPGSRGFTNQHSDSTTGLDDYGARYYDAVAGAFVSADTASDGLNRYAYVHGNPETFSDPSGHMVTIGDRGVPPPLQPPAPQPTAQPSPGPGVTSAGGGRDPSDHAIPNDAVWKWWDSREYYQAYLKGGSLGQPEYDAVSGNHYNLHIQPFNGGKGNDLHNFHITYRGVTPVSADCAIFTWAVKDYVPGPNRSAPIVNEKEVLFEAMGSPEGFDTRPAGEAAQNMTAYFVSFLAGLAPDDEEAVMKAYDLQDSLQIALIALMQMAPSP